jgi:unsaturated pyranuronate lyase
MEQNRFFNYLNPVGGIARNLAQGIKSNIFFGDNVMISVVDIEPETVGKLHSHPEEQWGVLLKGSGVRTQDGVETAVSEGDFWQTPGNVEHTFRAGAQGALVLDVFSPPRQAYRDGSEGFGTSAES